MRRTIQDVAQERLNVPGLAAAEGTCRSQAACGRETTRVPEMWLDERSREPGTPFITVLLIVGSSSGPDSSTCIVSPADCGG
jgi:hypothetical protein